MSFAQRQDGNLAKPITSVTQLCQNKVAAAGTGILNGRIFTHFCSQDQIFHSVSLGFTSAAATWKAKVELNFWIGATIVNTLSFEDDNDGLLAAGDQGRVALTPPVTTNPPNQSEASFGWRSSSATRYGGTWFRFNERCDKVTYDLESTFTTSANVMVWLRIWSSQFPL